MTREEYILLYEKYVDGRCTVEEIKILENYKDDFSIDTVYYWDEAKLGNEELFKRKALSRVQQQIKQSKIVRFNWKKYAAACAVFVVISSISVFLYNTNQDIELKPVAIKKESTEPPSNMPVLTLDDGKKISLTDSSIDLVYNETGGVISKPEGNELVYAEMSGRDNGIKYNTLSVPKGMSYKVALSDGSTVWLNAGSTLRYPVVFASFERKVELYGEAYFEVEKNETKPFKVIVNKSEVEVLGTIFNINAYHKEVTRTTLLEGSVRLKGERSQVILKPGQMGVDSGAGTIALRKANVESITDWKNGLFMFDDENLESILEKVAQWYGVEIQYIGKASSDYLYYGRLERTVPLEEILKSIQLTGKAKFEIVTDKMSGKERRVIVTSYK
ncbi:FecR family protein [Sphingobacterium yanglingense]|uniref:FecR family protein n=1 Tax=Sphingobacterium yanglingense TaxID=1437280 RepID=A0A4R6WEU7_9SPHI|nr:FecR family protein [Sphingobacterium yanglingense]TDQ75996.1 FecR family protein [Sphingobacterium yanglingense]